MNEAIQEHGIQRNSYAELQSKSFVALMLRAFFAKTCLSSSSDDCDQYDKLMTSLKPVDANLFKDFKTRLKESIQALNNKFIDARKDERLIEIVKLVDKLTAHSTKEEIDIISGLITELNEEIDENADEANKKGRGKISTADKLAADQAAAEKATAEKALADKLAADQAAAEKAAAEKALADQAAAEKAAAEKLAADQAAAEKAAAEKAAAAALEKAAAEKAKLEAELTELKKQLLESTLVDKGKREQLQVAFNKATENVDALNAQMDELTKEKEKAKVSGLFAKGVAAKGKKDVVDANTAAETAKREAETAKNDAENAKKEADTAKEEAETAKREAETAVKNAKNASLKDIEKAKIIAEDANKKEAHAIKEAAVAKDKQTQMERELAAALADVKAAKDLVNTAAAAAKLELDAIKQESQLLSANTAIEKETAIRELEETRKQLETVNAEKAAALAAKVAADTAKEAADVAADAAKKAMENATASALAEKEKAEEAAEAAKADADIARTAAANLRLRLASVRGVSATRKNRAPKTINQEQIDYIIKEALKYKYPTTDIDDKVENIRGALQNYIKNVSNNYKLEQLQKILANKGISTLISVLQEGYTYLSQEKNIERIKEVNLYIINLIIQLIIIDALQNTNPNDDPEKNAKIVESSINDTIKTLVNTKNSESSKIVPLFKSQSRGKHDLFKLLITAKSPSPADNEELLTILKLVMPMKSLEKQPDGKKPLNKKGGSNLKKTRKKKNKRLED